MPERNRAEEDRRRRARFKCGGEARISRLPSDGIFVPGKILDLSLGGCCVDTTLPIDFGVRTEIVVHVNTASFRAVGEVRALRNRFGAGMEFVHLSAGGKHMLADLLKAARREKNAESFRKQLEEGKLQAAMLSERFPFLGTILPAKSSGESSRESSGASSGASSGESSKENSEESSEPDQAAFPGPDRIVASQPLVISVDLFG
jgi:hypothetical protein